MMWLLILALVAYSAYYIYRRLNPAPNIDPTGKYVLISGCDSGFGHGLATELDKQGFNVLAAVLLPETVKTLKEQLSDKATVFQLDITNQNDIDAAYELIKKNTNVLHALVNNAGIAVSGNIDCTSMESLRRVMEVNFFGHVAMTKKFLPLLIAKRGSRVLNITSAAGFIASPRLSAYCASKFALESFSDCLRREMFPWGLHVSIFEPGFMRTPILLRPTPSFQDYWSTLSADVQQRWGEACLERQHYGGRKNIYIQKAENPQLVVQALQHAVMNTQPQIRYRPGWQSSLVFFPISMLPAWIADWMLMKDVDPAYLPAGIATQLEA